MPKLNSNNKCINNIGGVTIRPGANELTDAELNDVVGHKDGKFFVDNGMFKVAAVLLTAAEKKAAEAAKKAADEAAKKSSGGSN